MIDIGNYQDHYLKKDVFERVIDTCLTFFNLDACHYFSSPGMSWSAMLKMTGVKVEEISDIDMYLSIEKGQRGFLTLLKGQRRFLTLLKDMLKQIKNTWKTMILQNRQYTYRTMIWIICMVGQWVVIFLKVGLSG